MAVLLRHFNQWHLHFLETEHPCCTQVTLPQAIRYVNCVDPLNLVSNCRACKRGALNEGSILGICICTYIHMCWSHLEMSIPAHSHDWELLCRHEGVNGGQGLGMTFLGNEGEESVAWTSQQKAKKVSPP